MKGVILAGGTGSRLRPLTNVTNKHLLPVYDKPMIYYPIQTLISSGIEDILIVTGGENIGDFLKLLGSGKDFGVNFTYKCQDGAGGIPTALSLAKDFVGDESCLVILGDNIIEDTFEQDISEFENSDWGSLIYLKEVQDPERFGVAEVKGDSVVGLQEKPKNPKTNLAAIGVYIFNSTVFDIIANLKPSERGETEIVDVLNSYIKDRKLTFRELKNYWTDAGTFQSLFKASHYINAKSNQE